MSGAASGRSALKAGTRLGPYEIVAPLGAGGMGDVYRARDTRLDREVALKTLPPEFASDPERLARFDLEARAVGALSDPHVVHVYDVGLHEGTPFVVFELVEGDTLRTRLGRGPLSVPMALDIAAQTARGLAAAHERGIVHRDLKPENIVVARDGRVKILDFGLAKRMTAAGAAGGTATMEASPTSAGSVYGTVGYMAPEQIRGQAVDGRTDLFALGAILYEMLAGRRAFDGASPADVQSAILSKEPDPRPDSVRVPLPPGLDRVLRRMLEKDPAARWQHSRDLAFELELLRGLEAVEGEGSRRMPRPRNPSAALVVGTILAAAGAAALAWTLTHRPAGPERVTYQRLTFRNGVVADARFTPDGHTIVYSAAWDGESTDVYTVQPGSPEMRPLGYRNSALLCLSSGGDLGLAVNTITRPHLLRQGTLARVAMAGGAPRAIVDSVEAADWSRDGTLAVVIASGGRYRLECPPGRVLQSTPGWVSRPRFSPDGRRIAFFSHDTWPDDRGNLVLMDRGGGSKVLASGFASCQGIAWRPDGKEVWFSATRTGSGAQVYAATLAGHVRAVVQSPGGMRITDIAPDGRVLFIRDAHRAETHVLAVGGADERDLSWGDWSVLVDLSADGRELLFSEQGDAAGGHYAICIRGTDGSPVVRLGEGYAVALSPDARFVLSTGMDPPTKLTLLPTGAGEPRALPSGAIRNHYQAAWLPDGKRIFLMGEDSTGHVGGYVQDLDGGTPRRVLESLDSTLGFIALSPDGRYVTVAPIRRLLSLDGGPPVEIPGIGAGERLLCAGFSRDGREIFTVPMDSPRPEITAIDLKTGARRVLASIPPRNPAGVVSIGLVILSADERTCAFAVDRNLSEIYTADGLR